MPLSFVLGIKRSRFRDDDARASRADAEFRAKRKPALDRQGWRCAGCRMRTAEANKANGRVHLDLHHADDDHHNNSDDNLIAVCTLCHAYQHVGEASRRGDVAAEGMGRSTLVANVPEISAADLNLLQRAMGAALLDDTEAQIAKEVFKALAERCHEVRADFGSYLPADFAAGMGQLAKEGPAEYENRAEALEGLRLLFSEEELKKAGREFLVDNPSMPVDRWASVAKTVLERKLATTAGR